MSAAAGRRGAPTPADVPRGARIVRAVVVLPIRAYRLLVSPLKPTPTCRFHPTCSAYARDAILAHGVLRGGSLAVRRILKCHPWHEGGLDPVPAPDGRRHLPEEP